MHRTACLAAAQALLALAVACTAPTVADPRREAPAELDRYDVVWPTPSADASGSMPLGNGEVGLNVWVEPSGEVLFLISRTDAWSEASRLLKLGRVRLSLEPNPFAGSAPFEQRLVLREGRIEISGGAPGAAVHLELFVDSDSDVVHLLGRSEQPLTVRASVDSWRNARKRLSGQELDSSWTMRGAPDSIEVSESADQFVDHPGRVTWYHRNEHSIRELSIAHQGLLPVAERVPDPLLHRTFGGSLGGEGFARVGERGLETREPRRSFELELAAHASQCQEAGTWISEAEALLRASDAGEARERTRQWWRAFWGRSWVFVEGDPWPADDPSTDPRPPSRVTEAYLLQRYVQACGGRGNFPIKFNGSIFTVEPKFTGGQEFDPDWRRWGDAYWWQNTRLAYHAMLASGDTEMLAPLFTFYRGLLPLCEARAKLYYGASGAYFPETITVLGTYSNGDYGWDRSGRPIGDVQCPWWQWAWNQGPELVALGLDLFDATGERAFLERDLLPIARATLLWFDTRFERDPDGILRLTPTQALETYWKDVESDLPTVAGLHEITERLLALPDELMGEGDRELAARVSRSLPPIPTRVLEDGRLTLSPAARFDSTRSNCETPELYALFPFRNARAGTPLFEAAKAAFERRHDRFTDGWPQDGQQAALLGLVEEARANLLKKVRNSSARFRFRAMWGPNFDWLPDQCHGSNVLLTLQSMLVQEHGQEARILACWPDDWSVQFQLFRRNGSVVRGEHRASP
ncbi:MAG: hypothetical protein IPK67_12985 [Planctomycetes bacterium]|nr:hypothetical protein [Planctomycetota bacterium]